jgi:hypothetical protein
MSTEQLDLPKTPDDLTTEWVARALGSSTGREVVDSVVVDVQWGTATKVMLRVGYAGARGPDGPPERLCVKGGLDERLAGFDTSECYRIEAAFFADLAPTIDATIPRCWYTARDEQTGIVILDDLAAAGCTFGTPTQPWTPDLVAAALEVQAAWHAPFWGTKPGTLDWLAVGSPSLRAASAVLLGEEHWKQTFNAAGAPARGRETDDRERVVRAIRKLWELDDSGPLTLAHGDAHLGNAYVDGQGRPGFLDWQCVCLGPALWDVAYFIGGALSCEDRRAHERRLLEHYLDALAAGGGPRIGFDEAWRSYVHHIVHGFHWAVTPPVMQSPENVAAMAARYVAAIDDHDAVTAVLRA